MKYTKKQRHEIYKKAYDLLGKEINMTPINCLCYALIQACYPKFATDNLDMSEVLRLSIDSPFYQYREGYSSYDPESLVFPIESVFPEFKRFSPDEYTAYWFKNTKERKVVLLFMIEMTKS